MNRRWILLIGVLAFNACANSAKEGIECKIEMLDLTRNIQSAHQVESLTLIKLLDPDSEEAIRRYVQPKSDGSIIIIEQKHCLMYNLTVTILQPESVALNTVPARLVSTLEQTVVWKKWFNNIDAEKILNHVFESKRIKENIDQIGSISYNLNEYISTSTESSESHLRLVYLDAGTLPFSRIISIYIGVGGM